MSSQHWPTTTDIGYPSWPRPNGVPGVTEAMLRRCSGYGPDRPPLARKQSGLRHRCHPIDRPLPPACYMAVLLVLQHVSDAGLARARPGPVALKDVEQRVPRPGRSAADYPAAASFVCQHPGPGRHVALSATPRRLVRGGLLRHLARRRRRATQHGPAGHGTRTGIDNAGPLHPLYTRRTDNADRILRALTDEDDGAMHWRSDHAAPPSLRMHTRSRTKVPARSAPEPLNRAFVGRGDRI